MASPRRSGIIVALTAVIAAGCGPSDSGDAVDSSPTPVATATPAAPASPTPTPAPTGSSSSPTAGSPSSPGALTPPADFDPECLQIYSDEPGASIVFPDSNVITHDAGISPAKVTVIGCSNTFEAAVVYEFYHGSNADPTIEGHTMGGAYGDWAEFTFTETLWTPGEWTILVLEQDAATGDRVVYDEVFVTVD